MEALILAIIITWAVKKAAEQSHQHWQGAKGANRKSTAGQPATKRAASAVQHDAGYWGQQVLNGFPQLRAGLAAGWHAGRTAQAQGAEQRRKARTEHLERQVRLLEEIREHRRRQAEALELIRAARQPEPGPDTGEPGEPEEPSTTEGTAMTDPQDEERSPGRTEEEDAVWHGQPGGKPMSGDTTYTQQMTELQAIRRDAEEEVASTRRKRMTSRLDILQSLGLDNASLSEAAAIDDALQAQEKAAQQTLDAADAAIAGLAKRHGGIQEAVDSSPVDKPAQPEFYQD